MDERHRRGSVEQQGLEKQRRQPRRRVVASVGALGAFAVGAVAVWATHDHEVTLARDEAARARAVAIERSQAAVDANALAQGLAQSARDAGQMAAAHQHLREGDPTTALSIVRELEQPDGSQR
jgi:hypothetical protein